MVTPSQNASPNPQKENPLKYDESGRAFMNGREVAILPTSEEYSEMWDFYGFKWLDGTQDPNVAFAELPQGWTQKKMESSEALAIQNCLLDEQGIPRILIYVSPDRQASQVEELSSAMGRCFLDEQAAKRKVMEENPASTPFNERLAYKEKVDGDLKSLQKADVNKEQMRHFLIEQRSPIWDANHQVGVFDLRQGCHGYYPTNSCAQETIRFLLDDLQEESELIFTKPISIDTAYGGDLYFAAVTPEDLPSINERFTFVDSLNKKWME